MDTADPHPDTYKLWQMFTDPTTGKKAVAMSMTHADIFISVYTNLINIIMAIAWCILISFPILFLTPKKMTRTTHIAAITAWTCSDPWSASILVGRHTCQVFLGALRKRHPAELTWRAFWFDISLLAVALITALGGWALGSLFPISLRVGNIAPVDPRIVYLPQSDFYTNDTEKNRALVEYDSFAALNAFGTVDGAEARTRDQEQLVNLEWQPFNDTYSIQYKYKVTGTDMGLQKLRDLSLEVSGNCSFQYGWWVTYQDRNEMLGDKNRTILYEIYINWYLNLQQYPDIEQTRYNQTTETHGNNQRRIYVAVSPSAPPAANFYSPQYNRTLLNQETGRSYYIIIPSTAWKPTVGNSTDPWYSTDEAPPIDTQYRNRVTFGRPPLLCQEYNQWSSGDWKGTMKNLVSDGPDGPPVPLPVAIASLFQTKLGDWPMIVTLGQALSAVSLKSATRILLPEIAIDTKIATARDDMHRLLQASYLATRDLFRNSALAGSILTDLSSDIHKNAMRDSETGKPIPGAGDFVISSSAIQALNLSALISVVCVLVCLTFIALSLQVGRKLKLSTLTSESAGFFDRYVKLVTGLKAAQLYRMVDQLLADRAPGDKEGWDGNSHKSQAQWMNQTSDFPFIASNRGASPKDEIILPHFHVQVKGKDRRLTLDVGRVVENVGQWRSLREGDGQVRLVETNRQAEEELEMFGENQQPEAQTQHRHPSVSNINALHEDAALELKSDGTDTKQ